MMSLCTQRSTTVRRVTAAFRVAMVLYCLGATAGAEGASSPPIVLPEVLDLATAQSIALVNNPNLAAVAERVEQARQRVRQTRSLYFPQVQAGYTASHTELADSTVASARSQAGTAAVLPFLQQEIGSALSGISAPPGFGLTLPQTAVNFVRARGSVPTEVDNYSASLMARYILFDGFSRKYSHAMARFGVSESEAGLREAERLLLEGVALSFHGVQLGRENVAINTADEAFNQRLLKEARARLRVGSGSKSDVLNFEVRLRAARGAVLAATEQFEAARISLAALMGLPEAALPEGTKVAPLPEEEPVGFTAEDVDLLVARAYALRPDLERQRMTTRRADAAVGQRRAAFYPSVSLSAAQEARSEESGRFGSDDFATTVALSASVDLFTGGRNRAALMEAKHARREAEWSLRDAEIQVASEVRDAHVGLKTAEQQFILQRENADYVRQNRDLVEKEYRAGSGALSRLNQAQRDLIAAQGNLALARVALRQARHTLATATGDTLKLSVNDKD